MENGINGKYYKRTFLLFTAALFFAFLWATVIRDDSDFYHILTSGRDIWETGRIPVWNTHFAYDGLQIVIQQWLYAFIAYGVYYVFGWAGMQVFLWIEFAILFLLLYKIGTQRGLSHLHIVVCFIPVVFLCSVFLTPRPYLVTVILLLWQFYVRMVSAGYFSVGNQFARSLVAVSCRDVSFVLASFGGKAYPVFFQTFCLRCAYSMVAGLSDSRLFRHVVLKSVWNRSCFVCISCHAGRSWKFYDQHFRDGCALVVGSKH